MRSASRLLLFVIILALPLVVLAQQKITLGNLSFSVPNEWKVEQKQNAASLTNPSSEFQGVSIDLFADEELTGSLDDYFSRKWEQLRAGRTIVAASEAEKISEDGATGMIRVAAYAANKLDLVMVFAAQGRAIPVRATVTTEKQIDLIQEVLLKILDDVSLGEVATGTKATESPDPNKNPTTPANPGFTKKVNSDGNVVYDPPVVDMSLPLNTERKLTSGAQMADEAKRLAKEYAENPEKRTEILTLAVRASGYNIREINRTMIAPALTAKANNIYFLKGDISTYGAMSTSAMSFNLRAIHMATEWGAYNRIASGVEVKTGNTIVAAVTAGLNSSDPGRKFHANFICELYKATSGGKDFFDTFSWSESPCDPAIVLMLLHPYSQELGQFASWLHNSLRKPGKTSLWSSDLFATVAPVAPVQAPLISSGTIEDFGVGLANSIFEPVAPAIVEATFDSIMTNAPRVNGKLHQNDINAVEEIPGLAKNLEKYTKFASYANAVSALVKFISTYACMKTKFEVLQGEPLERTKSTTEGEVKRVRATVTIDSSKVQNWMKAARPYLAPIGLDVDQPPTGPVEGLINWTMLGPTQPVYYKATSTHGIRGARLTPEGVGEIDVAGRPQPIDLSRQKPVPYMRRVNIGFTISVKTANMAQDISDAIFGALPYIMPLRKPPGIPGPSSGTDALPILGPILETLYRYDWAYQGFQMDVRDWQFEAVMFDVGIRNSGNATVGKRSVSVNRLLSLVPHGTEFAGAKFVSTGNKGSTPNNVTHGMVTNEYAPESGQIEFNLRINDRIDEPKTKWVGDCIDGKPVEYIDRETWTAPTSEEYGRALTSRSVRLTIGNKGTEYKAWLNLADIPAGKTRIASQNLGVSERTVAWAESQLQTYLTKLELPLKLDNVVSYPSQGDQPAFGFATFSGKYSPNIVNSTLGINTFAEVFYTLLIIQIEPGKESEIFSR